MTHSDSDRGLTTNLSCANNNWDFDVIHDSESRLLLHGVAFRDFSRVTRVCCNFTAAGECTYHVLAGRLCHFNDQRVQAVTHEPIATLTTGVIVSQPFVIYAASQDLSRSSLSLTPLLAPHTHRSHSRSVIAAALSLSLSHLHTLSHTQIFRP